MSCLLDFSRLYFVLLHESRPTTHPSIHPSPLVIHPQSRRWLAGLHSTPWVPSFESLSLWCPRASLLFTPASRGAPFYPVLCPLFRVAPRQGSTCVKPATPKGRHAGSNKESQGFFRFFVAQAIQSLFPRLPDAGRGTSLFDRGTVAAGPEGDKLRLDTYPFLGSGEFKVGWWGMGILLV